MNMNISSTGLNIYGYRPLVFVRLILCLWENNGFKNTDKIWSIYGCTNNVVATFHQHNYKLNSWSPEAGFYLEK